MDEQERARRTLDAAAARHQARMAAISIEREVREAALQGRRVAHEARMIAHQAHMEALHLAERLRAEAFRDGLSGRLPGPKRRRPDRDGGEPVPVAPKPDPSPLSGAAAAPLDP